MKLQHRAAALGTAPSLEAFSPPGSAATGKALASPFRGLWAAGYWTEW